MLVALWLWIRGIQLGHPNWGTGGSIPPQSNVEVPFALSAKRWKSTEVQSIYPLGLKTRELLSHGRWTSLLLGQNVSQSDSASRHLVSEHPERHTGSWMSKEQTQLMVESRKTK